MRYWPAVLAAILTACGGGSSSSSPSQVVVEDTTPPVITLIGPNPQVIEAGAEYNEYGATASDNVDGDISASIVIDASSVNTKAPGQYTVTYDVSDAAGNTATTVTRAVVVQDTTAPVITLLGDDPQLILTGEPYVEHGATASDNLDGDLTASIVIDASAVDTTAPGNYSVTYDVSDAAGNPAVTVSRTVSVSIPPTNVLPVASYVASPIEGEAPLTVEFDASGSSDQDGFIVEYKWDFGDGETSSGNSPYVNHFYLTEGQYSVRLTVTDSDAGQASTTGAIVVNPQQSARWLGFYESSLIAETHLSAETTLGGASIAGTFEDADGRQGTISATIVDANITLELEQKNADCSGSFTGAGVLNDTSSLTFTFSGTNCEGEHVNGEGVLYMQLSDVLAWGQRQPSGLVLRDDELFWSNNGPRAINKLNTSTFEAVFLAPRMISINAVTADGTRLLWADLDDDGPSGCIGIRVARSLFIADPDGSNIRRLASGSFCTASIGTEQIFTDGTYAYWAKVEPYQRSIERVPLSGGASEVLAEPGDGFQGMAIDEQYIYWGEVMPSIYTRILRCPLNGCGEFPPEQILATDESIWMWSDFAVTGDLIVLGINRAGIPGYEVATLPKDGGALTDIAHSEGQILRVLADETSAYWVGSGYGIGLDDALNKVSLTGGDQTVLVSPFNWSSDIVVGETRVFFTQPTWPIDFNASVAYVAKSGGPVQILADSLASPYRLAIEPGGDVICADSDVGGLGPTGIYRISPAGAVSTMLVGFDGAAQITVDNWNLYGTQGFVIKRVSRDGGAGGTVAPTNFYIAGIDTDDTYVYWLDRAMSTVYRAVGVEAGQAELVSSSSGLGIDLAVRGGYVYWIEGNEYLYRAPSNGGAAERLVDDLALGKALQVDDEFVYVVESGLGITKTPVNGGERTVLSPAGGGSGWKVLAQDQANLYLADPWGIIKIDKADGTPFYFRPPVLFDLQNEASIAVDDRYLYWAEPALGAIKRQLK